MTANLSNISVGATLSALLKETVEGAVLEAPAGASYSSVLTEGTGADQADRSNQDVGRALTSGNNEDLDIYDLAGFDLATDPLRNPVTYTEVVAILVRNRSTSAGSLLVGGNGTAAAWNSIFAGSDTGKIELKPGGGFLIWAPTDPAYVVADTSNHLLRMEASGGNVTYDIHVLGRSA